MASLAEGRDLIICRPCGTNARVRLKTGDPTHFHDTSSRGLGPIAVLFSLPCPHYAFAAARRDQKGDTPLFGKLLGWFSVDMGIDLGTCNTLVCVRGQGIVLNEPSVVAVKKGTNQVLRLREGYAVGMVAKEMLGKTPGSISAIRPLKDGVISDFEITEAMLSYFINKVNGKGPFMRPRVVIAVPSGITAVEKRAVLDSAERAGARRVYLVEEPMAAGIGAKLPVV